jgi:hypothetical protein
MKTLSTIAAALLLTIGSTALAADIPGAKSGFKTLNKLNLPGMNWGSPEDVNSSAVEALRGSAQITMPAMNWGMPEDVNSTSVEVLRNVPLIAAPEMNWGSNEDYNIVSVEALKGLYFAFPEPLTTDSVDFDSTALEGLKNLSK